MPNRKARRAAAKRAASPKTASRRQQPTRSLSRGQRGGKSYDSQFGLREGLRKVAVISGEWAGIALPLDEQRLVIEPTYPMADKLMAIGGGMTPEQVEVENDGWKLRNQWYSKQHRCDILLMEKDGRIDCGLLPAFHHIDYDMRTVGCADAWGLEQEWTAMETLSSIITARAMRQYVLTGMFLESSPRSGIMYLFRRLKPTVALSFRSEKTKVLAALCMHPIAYYAGSWAGAMCPTDDVIAHLTMMRGDEHLFWKRCNQHPAYRPEAGL